VHTARDLAYLAFAATGLVAAGAASPADNCSGYSVYVGAKRLHRPRAQRRESAVRDEGGRVTGSHAACAEACATLAVPEA
jgi:hypothetical protein